jgi:hypothetical protein
MTEADFRDWEREIATAGACSHPVRLRGRVTAVDLATGEAAVTYTTATEPGGVLHVACGNRRESACPACAAVYKRDSRQLVRAGLVGGKGIPATISEHPCVFATFTAPSFGPVHARRERGGQVLPCRPRRDAHRRTCPHGRIISCPVRHSPDDPRLGRPLCPDCYDYESAVVFNAGSGTLWRRFTTYLPRELARLGGVTQKELRALVRPRFVKVTEFQARGVIHYHAIIRLDAATDDDDTYLPPPPQWSADLLAAAVTAASSAASVTVDVGTTDRTLRLRFGAQTDTRIVSRGTSDALTESAVANYIAKYVTKDAGAPGLPAYRIRSVSEIQALRCPPHYRRLIETAWTLGYRKWAHQLGHGGHAITKSRRFSVTYGQLRAHRRDFRRAQRHPDGELDPWGRAIDETAVAFIGSWSYAGSGYSAADSHLLALMSANNARDN